MGQLAYFKAGAWNVRTMLCVLKLKQGTLHTIGEGLGKEEMLCRELDRKGIAICALSEVRWANEGIHKHGEHTFVYSGRKDSKSCQGVAIVMNQVITKLWENPVVKSDT